MKNDVLREYLLKALNQGQAFLPLQKALEDLPREFRQKRPDEKGHTIYELLYHMMIAQKDILMFALHPDWESPSFPDGLWPDLKIEITEQEWKQTLTQFLQDFKEVKNLVENEQIDLTGTIPHAPEYTYLRQILLVIEHNAYHTGQILLTKKLLEA
jgi:uncharacterized damage-inducible protein DinB